jgi:ABC-type proline/glycine betaine transport system permease subunit
MSAALIGYCGLGIAVFAGGYYHSVDGIVWGYTLATTLLALPLHTVAYLSYRNRH